MNIWITGADGGIGSAIMRALREHARYPMPSKYDVCEKLDISHYIDAFEEPMDALVYAAGYNHLDWSKDISTIEMNHSYDVNVTGLIRCLQVRPEIRRCVVIGSDAARRPMRTSIAYNASKAALEAAVKVIARERAAEGFIINVVAPGLIRDTAMTDNVFERTAELRPDLDLGEYMLAGIPAGRSGLPVEVAAVVQWLIDEAPSYLNGSVIEVNGAR